MIKTAIRFQNNMVGVFDRKGEQIPEYQGQYEEVKEGVLRDAPPHAIFAHCFNHATELTTLTAVSRREW